MRQAATFLFYHQEHSQGGVGFGSERTGSQCFICDEGSGRDLGGYQSHPYAAIEMVSGTDPSQGFCARGHSALVVEGVAIRGAHERPDYGGAALVFFTTCQIAQASKPAFLEQFDKVARYMQRQAGLISYQLYESTDPQAFYQFINVAHWTSGNDFNSAFQSDDFKVLIQGGFEQTSQIVLTRLHQRRNDDLSE